MFIYVSLLGSILANTYKKELMKWETLPIQEDWIMVGARSWRKQGKMTYKALMKGMPWKKEAIFLPLMWR